MSTRIGFFSAAFLFPVLLLASTASAQAPLTIFTDSETYEQGDVVEITLQGPIGAEVVLEVKDPLGGVVDSRYMVLFPEKTVTLKLPLGEEAREGVYTVTASVLAYTVQTTFTVMRKPSPIIVLAPPGRCPVGEETVVIGFVYPGLSLPLEVHIKPPDGDWLPMGGVQSNASGWLTFSVKPESEGVYEVRVEYRGSPELAPAAAMANFTATFSKLLGCQVEPIGTK